MRKGQLLIAGLVLAALAWPWLKDLGEPRTYEFGTITAGGPEGWPVWIEDLTFDDSWGVPAGGIDSGIENRPPRGGYAIINPKPAPQKVEARWFSYRTQTFYEIEMELPDDLDDKLRRWFREYPTSEYNHSLITGFSGKGEALVWWRAHCLSCGYDRSQDFNQPIIENAKADSAFYLPGLHWNQTEQLVREGIMPPPLHIGGE